MDFTNAPGFKIIYYLVLGIIWAAIMIFLVRSAIASLKRTGGKINSIFDELFFGLLAIVAFVAFAQLPPETVITWLMKPLMWLWDMLLNLLRFVNVPV